MFYSPQFLKNKISARKLKRDIAHARAIAQRTKVSQDQIIEVLNQFNFDTDVMLHSSLMNMGKVKGGPRAVTNIILDHININKHTLLVSALPYRGNFASWLKDDMVFDVRTAPIAMGAINERISEMDGAKRSIHPTHSVVAIGPRADEYINEHHLGKTPFSQYSPYFKLIANRGKVLLFGTKRNNMTLLHAIEDMLGDAYPVRVYAKKEYDIKCFDQNGNQLIVHTPVHSKFQGLFRVDNMSMLDTKIKKGEIESKTIPIGESEISLIDCFSYTMGYLDILASGHSVYGKHRVTPELLKKIDEVKIMLESL